MGNNPTIGDISATTGEISTTGDISTTAEVANTDITENGSEMFDGNCTAVELLGLPEGGVGDTAVARCQSGLFEGEIHT